MGVLAQGFLLQMKLRTSIFFFFLEKTHFIAFSTEKILHNVSQLKMPFFNLNSHNRYEPGKSDQAGFVLRSRGRRCAADSVPAVKPFPGARANPSNTPRERRVWGWVESGGSPRAAAWAGGG